VLAETTFLGQVNYIENYIDLRSNWIYQTVLSDAYAEGDFYMDEE
jgi:hypothetical protein